MAISRNQISFVCSQTNNSYNFKFERTFKKNLTFFLSRIFGRGLFFILGKYFLHIGKTYYLPESPYQYKEKYIWKEEKKNFMFRFDIIVLQQQLIQSIDVKCISENKSTKSYFFTFYRFLSVYRDFMVKKLTQKSLHKSFLTYHYTSTSISSFFQSTSPV